MNDELELLRGCKSKCSKGSSPVPCKEPRSEDGVWRDPRLEDVSLPEIGSATGD